MALDVLMAGLVLLLTVASYVYVFGLKRLP
jgi:hypothetical protein